MGASRVGNTLAHNTISVLTSAATQIVAERPSRKSLIIQNLDTANPIYVGGSAVTSSTGVKVSAGQSISFDDFVGTVYARATGGTVDTRYLDVYA